MTFPRPAHAGASLTIDLDAIGRNWKYLRDQIADAAAECAAVVKADAYGLGAERVAPALADAGCRHFFVAHLDEAIRLRQWLPSSLHNIYVLHGVPPGCAADFVEHRLLPVLNSLPQVDDFAKHAAKLGRTLSAILQVDTGMSRLGLSRQEVGTLAGAPWRLAGLNLRYLMSHLACAEQHDNSANEAQRRLFDQLRATLPVAPASLANSSGIFLGRNFHYQLARPGAALHGVNPVPGRENPMRPVIRLQARVIQTRCIEAGDGVGYSHTWRATRPTRIATLAVGYADGFLRSLSNRALARFAGVELPLVGNVSMDTTTVDASGLPEGALPPGSAVDLIDPRHPLDAIAERAGTIGYEILTSLGRRYARHYVGAASAAEEPDAAPNRRAPFTNLTGEPA